MRHYCPIQTLLNHLKFTPTLAILNWEWSLVKITSRLPSTQGNFNWLKGNIQQWTRVVMYCQNSQRVKKHPSGATNSGLYWPQKSSYKNFNTEHVMRWRLLIEEFGPPIEYIKGPKNIVANALSRPDLVSSSSDPQDMADCYGLNKDDLPSNAFPLTYQLINHEQYKEKTLVMTTEDVKHYMLKEFHGGGRPHDCYVIKIGSGIPKDCKNESCSGGNHLNQRNHLSTLLLEKHERSNYTRCVYMQCMSKIKETAQKVWITPRKGSWN